MSRLRGCCGLVVSYGVDLANWEEGGKEGELVLGLAGGVTAP